jgi:hypothetical protein
MSDKTFEIARNTRTTLYEVHVSGCAHLISKNLERSGRTVTGSSGAEVAARFEANNEGCLTKLGPCAKEEA